MPSSEQRLPSKKKKLTVAPATTDSMIIMPVGADYSAKLLVNLKVGTKIKAFELYVSNTEIGPQDDIFSIIGDDLNILTQIQISGPDVVLSVTNNEASSVLVTVLQLS